MANQSYNANRAAEKGKSLARSLGFFSIGLGLAELLAPRRVCRMIGAPERPTLFRLLGLREIAHGLGIFSFNNQSAAVRGRIAGDAIDMAVLASVYAAPAANKKRLAAAAAGALGISALDVLAARRASRAPECIVRTRSVTIGRSADDVYNFWRDFRNLPRFMSHLQSVQVKSDKETHWVVTAPAGRTVEWDAEITEDRPGQLIAWQSLPGADVENSGEVRFQPAPGDRGTEVRVRLEYLPPAGELGALVAKLFGEEPGQQIKDELYHLKQVMETGEIAQSDASIHTLPHAAQPAAETKNRIGMAA